jgi:hypothetical protein
MSEKGKAMREVGGVLFRRGREMTSIFWSRNGDLREGASVNDQLHNFVRKFNLTLEVDTNNIKKNIRTSENTVYLSYKDQAVNAI